MPYQKQEFDPNAAGILAHRRVQVLASANWPDTNIPIFAPGIHINLSLMEGEPAPWLRIHLSPDPFRLLNRTDKSVRLQHNDIWVELATHDIDALFAKGNL